MLSFQSRVIMFLRNTSPNEGARGMATLKAISIRLKSVKSIKKITQSMKMVSAAKLTRAEKELRQAKPLGVGVKSFYEKTAEDKPPEVSPNTKTLYLAVTSDRGKQSEFVLAQNRDTWKMRGLVSPILGLCGAVHTSVAKVIRNALQDPGENVKIVCIGDKVRSLLYRSYARNFLFVCQEVGRVPPTFKDASIIATTVLNSEFEFEIAKVIYNRFRSVVSYTTEDVQFYDSKTMAGFPKLEKYEDVDEETLQSFVEFSVVALIFYAMKEGACSEQSSRMTAMDNASKNAGDMIGKLTLSFNRTRQAVITRELIEIISGASALQ